MKICTYSHQLTGIHIATTPSADLLPRSPRSHQTQISDHLMSCHLLSYKRLRTDLPKQPVKYWNASAHYIEEVLLSLYGLCMLCLAMACNMVTFALSVCH